MLRVFYWSQPELIIFFYPPQYKSNFDQLQGEIYRKQAYFFIVFTYLCVSKITEIFLIKIPT
jgi:hypothetical protein